MCILLYTIFASLRQKTFWTKTSRTNVTKIVLVPRFSSGISRKKADVDPVGSSGYMFLPMYGYLQEATQIKIANGAFFSLDYKKNK